MSNSHFLPPRGPEDIFPGDRCEAELGVFDDDYVPGFILEALPDDPYFVVALRISGAWTLHVRPLDRLRVPSWRIVSAKNPLLLAEQKKCFAVFTETLQRLRPDYCMVCGGEGWQHPLDCPGLGPQAKTLRDRELRRGGDDGICRQCGFFVELGERHSCVGPPRFGDRVRYASSWFAAEDGCSEGRQAESQLNRMAAAYGAVAEAIDRDAEEVREAAHTAGVLKGMAASEQARDRQLSAIRNACYAATHNCSLTADILRLAQPSGTAVASRPDDLRHLLPVELEALRTVATAASPDVETCLAIIRRLTGIEITPRGADR